MTATDALIKLGRASGRVVTSGMSGVPGAIFNIEITDEGRNYLTHTRSVLDGESGDVDDLVPLFAKRQFSKDFVAVSANAKNSAPLSVLFVDLDHFKTVNDSFDHIVGNEVLVETAKALNAACDKKGRCYRWGGEEYAVLLPNYSLSEAEMLAGRVRDSVARTKFKSYPHSMTVSIGVATCPETSSSGEDLLRDADKAMLAAKMAGRNRVCSAKPLSNA